jgi:DNA topoisomerase-1
VDCPVCGGDLVERQARRGNRRGTFYGCSSYPTCTFAVNQRPLTNPCPECAGLLLQRGRSGAKCNDCKWQGVVEGQQEQEEDAAEREHEAVGV